MYCTSMDMQSFVNIYISMQIGTNDSSLQEIKWYIFTVSIQCY